MNLVRYASQTAKSFETPLPVGTNLSLRQIANALFEAGRGWERAWSVVIN